jgi:hypothetical protein
MSDLIHRLTVSGGHLETLAAAEIYALRERLEAAGRDLIRTSNTLKLDSAQTELDTLRELVAEQKRTIQALMVGSIDDTTTPVIARIGTLEAETPCATSSRRRRR